MSMLIHSTPKESQIIFFPLNTNIMKKDYFLDIKENEVKMTNSNTENWREI